MEEVGSSCCGGLAPLYEKSKPILAMISLQFGFAGMNIISKVALNQGMSHFALVFYRHVVATLVTAPLAYVLERKTRPKLTFWIFCQIFLSGLLGVTMNQNFYYAGLGYTSTTFACALSNIVPALTFLMAIPLRLERVGIRSLAGQAKVAGTVVCVGGAMIMTVYKGITIQLWTSHIHVREGHANASLPKNWTKGSLLIVGSCISWSAWFIMQAKISKRYPAQYSSTALMCFVVAIQSGVLTLIFEGRRPSVWAFGWDIKLLTAVYSGVVATAISFCVMTWCIGRRGPVFVTMFGPLLLIIVAIMSSIILDEKLHLGSVIGSILIISGLYAVLWGKGKEIQKVTKIPKRDLEDSVSGHDLSNHPVSEITNSKELMNMNMQQVNSHGDHEALSFEFKKSTQSLTTDSFNNNSAIQQTTIDDSNFDTTILEDTGDTILTIEEESHKQTTQD